MQMRHKTNAIDWKPRWIKGIMRWGPVVVMMGCIYYASSTPSTQMPVFGGWDLLVKKGGHFLGYALLGLAFWRGVGVDAHGGRWWALAAVVLYACSDELHQWFVPGRNAWLVDVGIDTAGATVAIFLLGKWQQARNWLKKGTE